MNRSQKKAVLYVSIGAVTIFLNVIAWNSTAFCDGYIQYVFPVWVNTYGRIMGLAPFSVGEILLLVGAVLAGIACVLWIPYVALKARRSGTDDFSHAAVKARRAASQKNENEAAGNMAASIQLWIRRFYIFFAWGLLVVSLIMTLNCFILYHASTFSETCFAEEEEREYTLEDLILVRNLVVEKCNGFSREMERDEQGVILYEGDFAGEAVAHMRALGETYERLSGFYPEPKPLAASDFFSQQYICGYFFPFSMEANYNDVMYLMNKPASMCHELAHLRGYIYEDEANFIGFLACVESEDPVFAYSGYLSVLNYLDNDFYKAVGRDIEAYREQVAILPQVREDNVFVTEEEWERINGKALLDTEVVDEVSDRLMDATLKANGVRDGIISYDRVVKLLLQYYIGTGTDV